MTSHFHFFEVNRALRFDRAAAWGMRLATRPARRCSSSPASRARCSVPFGGARVVRGHGGLADGPLDAEGALGARRSRCARERGYRGA